MPSNYNSGFPPSVSRRENVYEPHAGCATGHSDESEKERYLLISNLENDSDDISKSNIPNGRKRRQRTKNNKTVSKSMTIIHGGVEYHINNAPTYGIYPKILHKGLEQVNTCLAKWKRVFIIRFDLHQQFLTPNNSMVSRFRDNLVRKLERAYETFEVGYIWVREQEKAKSQHYHFALFIDGDKVRHPAAISKIIRETWERAKVGNSVHIPKGCYYNLNTNNDEVMGEVVYRLSYMAKQRGKGYRPPQTNDYSTSRLTSPHRYVFN